MVSATVPITDLPLSAFLYGSSRRIRPMRAQEELGSADVPAARERYVLRAVATPEAALGD